MYMYHRIHISTINLKKSYLKNFIFFLTEELPRYYKFLRK